MAWDLVKHWDNFTFTLRNGYVKIESGPLHTRYRTAVTVWDIVSTSITSSVALSYSIYLSLLFNSLSNYGISSWRPQ